MFDADLNEHQSRFDRLQIAALIGLMLLGVAFVYSATMVSASAQSAAWYNQSWFRQVVWYALGIGAASGGVVLRGLPVARPVRVHHLLAFDLFAGHRAHSRNRLDARLGRAALD